MGSTRRSSDYRFPSSAIRVDKSRACQARGNVRVLHKSCPSTAWSIYTSVIIMKASSALTLIALFTLAAAANSTLCPGLTAYTPKPGHVVCNASLVPTPGPRSTRGMLGASLVSVSQLGCAVACNGTASCISFTYAAPNGTCHL